MTNIPAKMAEAPTYTNLGVIADPAGFSATCQDIFNAGSIDLRIMWSPCNGYDLDQVPAQFHPTILKAVDIHQAEYGQRNRTCYVHFNQGLLAPQETFRISQLHFDAYPEIYPDTDYKNNDVFIVSDNLPTQFSLQTYKMPERIYETDMVLNLRIIEHLEQQVDEARMVTPAPYDLVRCDSFTVHRAQIPQTETRRTFFMVRFL